MLVERAQIWRKHRCESLQSFVPDVERGVNGRYHGEREVICGFCRRDQKDGLWLPVHVHVDVWELAQNSAHLIPRNHRHGIVQSAVKRVE